MPSNNPYQNDPYGETSTVDQVRDLALSAYRPSTWISMYGSNPGMWSIGKGVYVPFIGQYLEGGGSAVKAGLKNITSSYQGRNFISGTVTAAKRTIGAVHKGGYVGQNFFNRSLKVDRGAKKALYKEARDFFHDTIGLDKLASVRKANAWRDSAYAALKQGKTSAPIKGMAAAQGKMGTKVVSKAVDLTRYAPKVGLRTAAKYGIAGAKAVSIVGAAMFAWDMAKMVGEPLGAYAMNQLYSGATNLQNKFNPEMGGQLGLAYLSQGAATERQRALQAMSKASITGRSAFGQEAMLQHR